MLNAITDDSTDTMYTAMLVPDNIVLIQEHQSGRLRSVQWLDPTAAAELGRLLVAIANDAGEWAP